MCKCNTNTTDFEKALLDAESKNTKRTKYGIYFQEFKGRGSFPFVDKVKNIEANEAVCCYYLSDGTKVDK